MLSKIFLHNYLSHFSATVVLACDDAFCAKSRSRTKKASRYKIRGCRAARFAGISTMFFSWAGISIVLQPEEFTRRQEQFSKAKIDKLLIALPVQCIEYWLWYLKHRQENPGLTKNVSSGNAATQEGEICVYGNEDRQTNYQTQSLMNYRSSLTLSGRITLRKLPALSSSGDVHF